MGDEEELSWVVHGHADEHFGIPKVIFFDDVEKVVKEHEVQNTLQSLTALFQRYKFWETKFMRHKQGLQQKIPDVKRAIDVVKTLQKRSKSDIDEPITTRFELGDQIYVKAEIPKSDSVSLWLGANVMIEYKHEEAIELLQKNLETAETNLDQLESHLNFIRDQVNVTEVNMTRVYNYDVLQRRKQPEASK
mmetsp:Transcript_45335/g.176120  ORF Transcript_45335/g.176120 Transcript_45335/m.176120 type:complete len:191 (-) Transcript_45335:3252-3824(-)